MNERFYLVIEKLLIRATSYFSDFAGKDGELFWSTGVLEHWSVGKSQNPNFNLNQPFHYSITPALHYSNIIQHKKKTVEARSAGNSKPLKVRIPYLKLADSGTDHTNLSSQTDPSPLPLTTNDSAA